VTGLPLTVLLASILATAAPLIIASLGETITEKAGVINLSLDGSMLLAAMVGFLVGYETHSFLLAFTAAAAVGALVAAIVAVFGIYLGQLQVAVGFALTLMCRDLAYFLGNPYSRLQGPQLVPLKIPLLGDIPLLGPVLFQQPLVVYFSLLLVGAVALVIRLRPQLSAATRCLLWWLVGLQLVVGMAWQSPVELPWLATAQPAPPPLRPRWIRWPPTAARISPPPWDFLPCSGYFPQGLAIICHVSKDYNNMHALVKSKVFSCSQRHPWGNQPFNSRIIRQVEEHN